MEAFVTTGLVLKETRYKESDRILTILTPELGVISAAAQSSLRLKSKLFSACGLFCYSELTLVPGRNMYTVREAEVKNVFHGILLHLYLLLHQLHQLYPYLLFLL